MSKDHEHHAFLKASRDRPVAGDGPARIVRPTAFRARTQADQRRTPLALGSDRSGVSGATGAGTGAPATSAPAAEEPIPLRPDHPQTYTVVPGDTLWSIAQRFLQKPWQWRQIWRQNAQIRDPNRIYPGDVLRFSYDPRGKPLLEVAEREDVPLLKLTPQARTETLTQPIPPVPRDAVESFLTRGRILSNAQWRKMPYIVADDDEQTVFADRDRVYARGARFDQPRYQVFRIGEELHEPGSDRSLGVPGIYLGQAILERDEDPASFMLANITNPVRAGDRLLELEEERELYSFEPHPVPPDTTSGAAGHRGRHHCPAQPRCHPDHPIQ